MNNVLTPIKPSKPSGRIRPQFNQSDEEDEDGRIDIEPIPPQPFGALLRTQPHPIPAAVNAAFPTQSGKSSRPLLGAGEVPFIIFLVILTLTPSGGPIPGAQLRPGIAPSLMEAPAPPPTQPLLRARSVMPTSTEPPAPPLTQPSLRARPLAPASMEPPAPPPTQRVCGCDVSDHLVFRSSVRGHYRAAHRRGLSLEPGPDA